MTNQSDKIIIYTDGGCRGNPGIGGWGVYLIYQKQVKKLSGYELETTNNRMELTAVIKGLSALKKDAQHKTIEIWTDSKYVKQGATEWLENWKVKNWKTSQKKSVKNQDLWQQLDKLLTLHTINWHWVKGHSGNEGNEIADYLANCAMDKC